MNTYTETVGNKLNKLLDKTKDAEKGFKKAAEHADSENLASYFNRKSTERKTFGNELKMEIISFGEQIDKSGSAAGVLHRGWMDVKAWFAGNSDEAMLEEAITGERAAVDEYKDVLMETSLPRSTTDLLTQQMSKITSDLTTIKRLEDIA
ncbi:PA2169 family four-helix-bundle protein [Aurantibacter sp.]|uniref:ferritin-like domain-containing protein n=1 Tax=Aurantibacter sp. TaxID=2807103 RepID=UPI0032632286